MIKQISVFLENRGLRLEQLTDLLRVNEINIVSMSLGDSSDYGLIRMIVSNPDKAKKVLRESGYAVVITNVLAVELPHRPGALNEMLKILVSCNLEYMYALATIQDSAIMVVKMTDMYSAMAILESANYNMIDETTAYQLGH